MKHSLVRGLLALAVPVLLLSCDAPPPTTAGGDTADTVTAAESGTLDVFGNAEERPQVGFTSGDGWELSFNHIYVNFANIRAYQSDPPYDYASLSPIANPLVEVDLGNQSVDLVTGDEDAPQVLLASVTDAPAGQYNAISYRLTPAAEGPGEGYSLVIIGTATRDGETIDFVLNLEQELAYYCGEYIGDERKGFLTAGDRAELEATLHLDHLFGEGSRPADDPLNQSAFGFNPLAALAVDGRVEVNMAALQGSLSTEDFARLQSSLVELGHAGEGHCFEAQSGQTS
jgi:hypothetical protein